jgi:hypothetical protein
MTSGLSICQRRRRDLAERGHPLLARAADRADHDRRAPSSARWRPIAANAGCDSPSMRRGSSGTVTNILPSPWPSAIPHVGRVQHRAHQHLEVLGLERRGDGADEAAVGGADLAREDDGVRAERGLERRGDVQRLRAPAGARGAEVVAIGEVAAEQRVDAAGDDVAVDVEQHHRANAGIASLSAFIRTDSSVETLWTGVARNSLADAGEGAVHAVELLADVVVDDAGLDAQAVALGGVERRRAP